MSSTKHEVAEQSDSDDDIDIDENTKYRFCPSCGNVLILEDESKNYCLRLVCPTCPLFLNVTRVLVSTFQVTKFDDDDKDLEIVDEKKENSHRQKTEVICPTCNHNCAYFYQMQTRSADEPMTNFYECEKCKHNWRD